MKFLRAAAGEVLGLFVSDWFQVVIVLVILALGWLAVIKVGTVALAALVILLAAQMVWFARAEARRRQGSAGRTRAAEGTASAAGVD